MIPTRLLPNYRLWQLYIRQGDTVAARRMAQKILEMPLKVENTFTSMAKEEVCRELKRCLNYDLCD